LLEEETNISDLVEADLTQQEAQETKFENKRLHM